MKLTAQRSTLRSVKSDGVAIFIRKDKQFFKNDLRHAVEILGTRFEHAIEMEHFTAKEAELLTYLTDKKTAAKRIYVVGLGEQKHITAEQYRRAAAAVARHAKSAQIKKLALCLPERPEDGILSTFDTVTAVAEGAILSVYAYDKYITEKKSNKKISELIVVLSSIKDVATATKSLHDARIVCDGTLLARDLENAPPNELYPETLADAARSSATKYGYRAVVWDKKKIEQTGFGGLMAVNAGSDRPPRFIILEHNAGRTDLETIVLVGKGITFDAGGISIKPASGMSEMKMDMSGAAAVIGTLEAVARLKLPVHCVGLIPATENLLGGSAMRPGDILTHYGGKTSEVDNTDAEGRLVLADALAYASHYKPKVVIDLATLTGACVVALGSHASGMMGNDDNVMKQLKAAGEKTFERVWQLPLYAEYEKQIKSDVADVKNVGGRWAGAITAGLFLKKFIGEYPWVHLDIAGTAILEEAFPYAPKGGSGVGVRLLVEFIKHWKS